MKIFFFIGMFKKELLDKIDNNHSSNNNNILRNECDYNYYILKFVGEEQEKKIKS